MPKQVTNYSLLLSCPSDVKEEIEIIKDIVNNFNRMYGEANNVNIILKHWSKDSFPQLGDSPQTLLNNQFILDCDAVVAVFWTRFGTPTDKYESGTEEEIEELLKNGKQVFLYFSDCPIQPSLIDNEQHQKILAYRNKNKDRGVYFTYSNIDEFKKLFLNHLSLYFVAILNNSNTTTKSIGSKLIINGVNNGKISDEIIIHKKNYLEMQYIQEIKVSILELFKNINSIKLPIKIEDNLPQNFSSNLQDVVRSIKIPATNLASYYKSVKADIDERTKDIIIKYAIDNNIDIEEGGFFHVGELSKYPRLVAGDFGFNQSYGLNGSEDEKRSLSL